MKNLQRYGGVAALGHTATLVAGMILSFIVMFPLLDAAPGQAVRFLADHQALVTLWKLIVDGGSAITLVIMLLALYQRLKAGSLARMRVAVVFGCLWAGLTIGASDLMLHNSHAVPAHRVAALDLAPSALIRSCFQSRFGRLEAAATP